MDETAWMQPDSGYPAYCHEADMDGGACALLLHNFTGVDDIRFVDYPLPPDLGAEGPTVVCDLRLPADGAAWHNPELVVFDHHGRPPDGHEALVAVCEEDGPYCAGMLLAEWLYDHGVSIPSRWRRFLRVVNVGDLYQPEYTRAFSQARRYSWLLNKLGMETLFGYAREDLDNFLNLPELLAEAIDVALKRENQTVLRVAIALGRRIQPPAKELPEFQLTWLIGGNRSEVLHDACEDYGGPVAGIDLGTLDRQLQVQVLVHDPHARARDLATAFGGGGHANAAGWTMDLATAIELWGWRYDLLPQYQTGARR
ncbi:MAG: hypothetical protein U9R79_07675 [Armatimonadota bacterium]|nr:hypothetical protein [Armatimonadota bacterium]